MKLNIAVVFGCLLAFVCVGSAQTRTVTNTDLEKFKTKRIQAEKDLRENYAKLGFPSPEELAKQNAADEKARLELFQRLQAERLERERLAVERQRLAAQNAVVVQPQIFIERQDTTGYLYGYSFFGNRRMPWRSPNRYPYRGNVGWRVAGGMIIYDGGGTNFTVTATPQRQGTRRW